MKTWFALFMMLALATVALADGPRPPAEPAPDAPQVDSLPVGTAIKMKLETPISTRTNSPGQPFAGRVTEPVMLGGKTAIPVGAALEGHIMRADEPRRIQGKPTIDLRPEWVTLPNGKKYQINAVIVDSSARPQTDVNDEGKIKGQGRDAGDWKETAIGTGAGASMGALAGGAKGLGVGAVVGATATTVHWLTKRKSATLPAGTEIVMELSRPMAMSPAK